MSSWGDDRRTEIGSISTKDTFKLDICLKDLLPKCIVDTPSIGLYVSLV
jgi:hypothetical protein